MNHEQLTYPTVIHIGQADGKAYAGAVYIKLVVNGHAFGFVARFYAEVAALALAVGGSINNKLVGQLQGLANIGFVIGGKLVKLGHKQKLEVDGKGIANRAVYLRRYINRLQRVHKHAGEGSIVGQ